MWWPVAVGPDQPEPLALPPIEWHLDPATGWWWLKWQGLVWVWGRFGLDGEELYYEGWWFWRYHEGTEVWEDGGEWVPWIERTVEVEVEVDSQFIITYHEH